MNDFSSPTPISQKNLAPETDPILPENESYNSYIQKMLAEGLKYHPNLSGEKMHEFLETNKYCLEQIGVQNWALYEKIDGIPPKIYGDVAFLDTVTQTYKHEYPIENGKWYLIFSCTDAIEELTKQISFRSHEIVHV